MDPVVELNNGFVRGLVEKHEDGFDYYAFKGIPFAEPPIGELRFEDPVPKKRWTGILDCKKFGPRCFQRDFLTGEQSYDENCLHLNVYSRSINDRNDNKPVLVWIHGGEFSYGTADDSYSGPDYLIRKNIVLVTINFRLGVLGFLDLEDEVAPGNQGLKDQVMALQWVQKNIRQFGGNPSNVTVGGVSAGATSAHYLALSPLSKNLLHKIICHGGVVFYPWIGVDNPRSHALKLCSLLGKTSTDSKEIVSFLRSLDAKTLLDAQQRLVDVLRAITFTPGADGKSAVPFMPLPRYAAAERGVHLPALVGHTSNEGLITLYNPVFFKTLAKRDYFAACDRDFGMMINYNMDHTLGRYNLSVEQIRRLYYKGERVSEENLRNYIDFQSDLHFVEGVHRFVRVQADTSSAATYMYMFNYDSPISLSKALLKDATIEGAGHYDDIRYLFKMSIVEAMGGKHFAKGTEDYKIMEQMTEMWANFATYGRPTVETSDLIPVQWQPIADGTLLRYMSIDEDLTMQKATNVDQKLRSAACIKVQTY